MEQLVQSLQFGFLSLSLIATLFAILFTVLSTFYINTEIPKGRPQSRTQPSLGTRQQQQLNKQNKQTNKQTTTTTTTKHTHTHTKKKKKKKKKKQQQKTNTHTKKTGYSDRLKSTRQQLNSLKHCNTTQTSGRPIGPRHVKTCFRAYANSEGPDQPAHPHSLTHPRSVIRAFVIH